MPCQCNEEKWSSRWIKTGETVCLNEKLNAFFGDSCKYEGIQHYGEKINVVSGLRIFDIIFLALCTIPPFTIKKCNDTSVNRNLNGINCSSFISKSNSLTPQNYRLKLFHKPIQSVVLNERNFKKLKSVKECLIILIMGYISTCTWKFDLPFLGLYSMEVTFLHRNLTDIVYIM